MIEQQKKFDPLAIIHYRASEVYDLWDEYDTYDFRDLVLKLDEGYRLAILVDNLDKQMERGGFGEWFDKGCYEVGDLLFDSISKIDGESVTSIYSKRAVEQVLAILNRVLNAYEALEATNRSASNDKGANGDDNTDMLQDIREYMYDKFGVWTADYLAIRWRFLHAIAVHIVAKTGRKFIQEAGIEMEAATK